MKGVCERTRKFVEGNDKYDIESIVILASTNDLRHKNVAPESLIFLAAIRDTEISSNI